MRQNLVLLFVLVFALCACGTHRTTQTLQVSEPPVIEKISAVTPVATSSPSSSTEEFSLVLPLPASTEYDKVATELDAYKPLFAGVMRTEPDVRLRITAHTALLHSAKESMTRSERIADAVKKYLLADTGIDPSRIQILPRGAEAPLFANSSAYGRARNNRMELTLENISKSVQKSGAAPEIVPAGQPEASAYSIESPEPLAVSSEVLTRTYTFRFASGHSGLNSDMLQQAESLSSFLKANPGVKAVIVGHTDNVGRADNNQRLSYQRGLELQITLLTKFGIPAERTEVRGAGEDRPIADNRTALGRSLNRRVEVSMLPYKPVLRFAEIPSRSVIPGESAAPVARKNAPPPAPAYAQVATVTDYRQRLERLAKLYGAREVIYSGGVRYVPLQSAGSIRNYRVEISVSKCTLWLYRILPDGSKLLVRPYKVATAKRGTPYPQGSGYVTAIDYDPWWFPTARMVRQAAAKGRRLEPVPPGNNSNPMGAFKIYLSHANNGGSFRIHGTNKPSLIGQRVSQGCIRMTNNDGLELARTIKPGTEVVVYE